MTIPCVWEGCRLFRKDRPASPDRSLKLGRHKSFPNFFPVPQLAIKRKVLQYARYPFLFSHLPISWYWFADFEPALATVTFVDEDWQAQELQFTSSSYNERFNDDFTMHVQEPTDIEQSPKLHEFQYTFLSHLYGEESNYVNVNVTIIPVNKTYSLEYV